MKRVRAVLVVGLIFSAIGLFFYQSQTKPSKSIILDIYPNMSFSEVSKDLARHEIINFSKFFYFLGRLFSYSDALKVGEYEVNTKMSYRQILKTITSNSAILRSVIIPEGYNIYQVAETLEERLAIKAKNILRLCHDKDFIQSRLGVSVYSLEGYLFPDTYNFSKYVSAEEVLSTMVKNFFQIYKKIDEKLDIKKIHRSVIMASIIEKETASAKEYALVSSVFHNRLQKKMRLQSDPTIIYGILNKTGVTIKNIRKKHIRQKTTFNTYRVSGLPKGPISNPGYGALHASKYPAQTEYLFFVSKNNGEHIFEKNYKDHVNNVNKYQKRH